MRAVIRARTLTIMALQILRVLVVDNWAMNGRVERHSITVENANARVVDVSMIVCNASRGSRRAFVRSTTVDRPMVRALLMETYVSFERRLDDAKTMTYIELSCAQFQIDPSVACVINYGVDHESLARCVRAIVDELTVNRSLEERCWQAMMLRRLPSKSFPRGLRAEYLRRYAEWLQLGAQRYGGYTLTRRGLTMPPFAVVARRRP